MKLLAVLFMGSLLYGQAPHKGPSGKEVALVSVSTGGALVAVDWFMSGMPWHPKEWISQIKAPRPTSSAPKKALTAQDEQIIRDFARDHNISVVEQDVSCNGDPPAIQLNKQELQICINGEIHSTPFRILNGKVKFGM